MKQTVPSYKAFLKMLSRAYSSAGLPLTTKPLSTFVIHATDQENILTEDYFNDISYAGGGVVIGGGNNTIFAPLTSEALRILKALDQLYDKNVPITPSLIVRIIHAEKTRYEDEPLIDKKRFISFTPLCVGAIQTYVNEVELRLELEKTFTGLAGPILEYNSNQNADVLSGMLNDATVFNYSGASYYATDLRPSYAKALRHLTNYLYYNMFCFEYAKGYLSQTFLIQGEVFVRNMLDDHLNKLQFLTPSFSFEDI